MYWQAGFAHEDLGEPEKAAAIFERGAKVPGPPGAQEALLVRANVLRHNTTEAARLARMLEQRASRHEVTQVAAAWAYAALGDRQRALLWLNRALDAREGQLRDSIRSAQFRSLRGDPRYDELLRRVERGFTD